MTVRHKGSSVANSKTMADSNSMADTDSMAQSNSMADSNSMPYSDSMADCNTMADAYSMANAMTNSMTKSMSNSIICHFRHIASEVVGMVVDMLGPTIREQHSVGSLSSSSTIVRLVLAEVGPGQVISHAVVVGVGNNLPKASMTT